MPKKNGVFECKTAESSVVGIVIILMLTTLSVGTILLYGIPTINDMQDMAKTQKVEQAFTVLDSRVSKVALGESPLQTTSLSLMGGTLEVKGEGASYNNSEITIVLANIDAPWYDSFSKQRYRWGAWEGFETQNDFTMFNVPMGYIIYNKDDRIVGYEGGGVWSKYPTGQAVMISPPEFNYNGETLTLPVMCIIGNTSISGGTDVGITVSSTNIPTVLYPDPVKDKRMINPLKSDKVLIYIKSNFYNAWCDYANTLAYTSATVDETNSTAVVELEVMPPMGKSVLTHNFKVGALNVSRAAPMHNFSFDFGARSSQGLNPTNYQISATSGTKTLIYSLAKKGGANQLQLTVTYQDTAAASYTEKWNGVNVFPVKGTKQDQQAIVDLLDKNFVMKYASDKDFSWNDTSAVSLPPNVNFHNGDETSLYNITQHYMRLITMDGSVKFSLNSPGKSDPVDYDKSSLTLYYDGMPGAITYLHVTRNDLLTLLI
ncbi:MAG: hypothetical protein H5T43_04605 [Methanomethylovorans sp.]|jgi:hypothetical protein|nr:hypothetical protein [Methanomethylovorans sp.]